MNEKDHRCPRGKLHCCNWLADIPAVGEEFDIVEVQFKNTRKGYYRNSLNLPLETGDVVAVEASPGHDIGTITLKGPLVALQMKRAGVKSDAEIRRVFRLAKPSDLEKFEEARARENDTMIRARKIAESLKLNMKIGDVEYQGDGNKAIFYYIADERVDFRQLIKVLAETFKIRIEMKQIGARQEAGRIGGIGSCGRPLCCASWMTSFVSVGTSAARYQDISLNPQKLAGQCAKLKCCLNFEVDTYVESSKFLPGKEVRLETADNTYYHFKTDIFKKEITYSTDKSIAANLVTIDAQRAFEVIEMNRHGEKPAQLQREGDKEAKAKPKPMDLASQDDLTRFDKSKKKKKKKQKGDKPAADKQGEKQPQQSAPQTEKADKPEKAEEKPQQPRQDKKPERQGQQPAGEPKQRDRKPGQKPRPPKPRQGGNQPGQKGQDAPKADTPKPQAPKPDAPKPQAPKPEAPKPAPNREPKAFRE